MPTIKEIRADLDGYDVAMRKAVLPGLFRELSPPSHEQLRIFQQNWDRSRPFQEFVQAHNAEIKTCIDLECSEFGVAVREALGFPPLILDRNIEEAAVSG